MFDDVIHVAIEV